jgi:hypothetical protein
MPSLWQIGSVNVYSGSLKQRTAALLTGLLGLCTLVVAQVDTGSILGTVKDSSGAVMPGVKITLTNNDTGLVQTQSGTGGEYTFSPLKIGHYSVVRSLKASSVSSTLM